MKKFFHLFAFALLVVGMVACGDDDNSSDSNPGKQPPRPEPMELAQPEATVVEVTETGFTIAWAPVDHAAAYAYTIGTDVEIQIQEMQLSLNNLESETTYQVKIKAIPGDDPLYCESAWKILSVTTLEAKNPDNPDNPQEPTSAVKEGGYYIQISEYEDGSPYYNQIYVEHQEGNEYLVYNFFDYADEILPATYDPDNQTFTLSGYSYYEGELGPFFGYAMYYFDEEQTMSIGLFCFADPEDENAYGDDPFVITVEDGYLSTALCDLYEMIFDEESGENLGYYSIVLAGDKYSYGEVPATRSHKMRAKGDAQRIRK